MVKKLFLALLCLGLLTSCSKPATTQISFKDDVLVNVDGQDITKGDIYQMLKNQDIATAVLGLAQNLLVESKTEVTPELTKKAQDQLQELKDQYKDKLSAMFQGLSEEAILSERIIPYLRLQSLVEMYYQDHVTDILAKDQPVKLQVLYYDTKEDAEKALKDLETMKSIEDFLKAHPVSKKRYSMVQETIMKPDLMPQVVQEYIKNQKDSLGKWASSVIEDGENKSFILIKLIETDSNALKDAYKDLYIQNPNNVNEILMTYLKEANLTFHDQDIKRGIENNKQTKGLLEP